MSGLRIGPDAAHRAHVVDAPALSQERTHHLRPLRRAQPDPKTKARHGNRHDVLAVRPRYQQTKAALQGGLFVFRPVFKKIWVCVRRTRQTRQLSRTCAGHIS
jgi:hypothetical protein